MALKLFEGYGIELEYILVERSSLNINPVCDAILLQHASAQELDAATREEKGGVPDEIIRGDIAWSNELVRHVIELKTNGPAKQLLGLDKAFHQGIRDINASRKETCLLGTAMHPWMDPNREMELWPYGYRDVYSAYDHIFGCKGHGWSNLQSMHINLPFNGDEEFTRLHAAIRAVLAILPAIAASSPICEGKLTGILDTRLAVYRTNQRAVPEIAGDVVPENIKSIYDYERSIFAKIYSAIAPHDPQGLLQHEWLNSRGAIARFDRDAIEIRVIDVQESPRMDIAIAALIAYWLKSLVAERSATFALQRHLATEPLAKLFMQTTHHGPTAAMPTFYTRVFGLPHECSAGHLRRHLIDTAIYNDKTCTHYANELAIIRDQGSLAERIVKAARGNDLLSLYQQLAKCLADNQAFTV